MWWGANTGNPPKNEFIYLHARGLMTLSSIIPFHYHSLVLSMLLYHGGPKDVSDPWIYISKDRP